MTTMPIEPISVGSLTVRFLLEGAQTDGALAMFEFHVPTGGQPPAPHSHDGYEETVYCVEGVLTWTMDGEVCETAAGELVSIPRGVVHKFENRADEDAKAVAVVTPGILGPDFFREVGAAIPDREKIGEVMRRHGLTPA
jgi:quercetin dioxygenase-like cupin family protein